MISAFTVTPVTGLPEVVAGDDLAALIGDAVPDLRDGDILVVTSKIVSKAEGRVVATSAAAVGAHYGPGLIGGWLVDDQDKAAADDPALAGIEVRALPLYMSDLPSTTAIARAALDLAAELAPGRA